MAVTDSISLDPAMRICIQNCLDCHTICEHCAKHCLEMGGEHASKAHQTTMRDCAQICAVSADFMLRHSPIHAEICRACSIACERCHDECARMAHGDPMMTQCAEICGRCAESCRQMATTASRATMA